MATSSSDWMWVIPIVVYGFIFFVAVSLFAKFAQAIGLGNLLGIWAKRQKPFQQKREDYDQLFMHDLKRSAKRNRVPARELFLIAKDDWEHPPIFWGKIRGVNAETDVIHILVRRRFGILHELVFVPKDRITDLHSRELHISCVGLRAVARYFWFPIWGADVSTRDRERYRRIVTKHIDALYDEFRYAIVREEGTAQTVAAMEPRLASGRVPVLREPQVVALPEEDKQGEELLE